MNGDLSGLESMSSGAQQLAQSAQEMSLIASTIVNRSEYVDANSGQKGYLSGLGTPGKGIDGVLTAKGQYEGFSMQGGAVHLAATQQGRVDQALASPNSIAGLQYQMAGAVAGAVLSGRPVPYMAGGRDLNQTVMGQTAKGWDAGKNFQRAPASFPRTWFWELK